MHESVVSEDLEAMDISVQGVMQLRSGRRDQSPEKERPVTPYSIVTIARCFEVVKFAPLLSFAGLG